jgi:hypothetical protein
MAGRTTNNGATLDFQSQLWAAADLPFEEPHRHFDFKDEFSAPAEVEYRLCMEKNMMKYNSYRKGMDKVNEGIAKGFYLEAITIEESILTDRMLLFYR